MKHTGTRAPSRTGSVPEDLLVFQARMAGYGISVRLPTARPGFRLAEPITVTGEPLSETVVKLRSAEP